MTSKQLIFLPIFLGFLLLGSDGKRGGDSSADSSNSSSSNRAEKVAGIILMVFLCIGGMISKLLRCFRKQKRREHVQEQMNHLDFIHENNFQIFTIDRLNPNNLLINETDLSSEKMKKTCFILVPSPDQPFDDASEKLIDVNKVEELEGYNSNCRQQITSKEKDRTIVIPIKDIHA